MKRTVLPYVLMALTVLVSFFLLYQGMSLLHLSLIYIVIALIVMMGKEKL